MSQAAALAHFSLVDPTLHQVVLKHQIVLPTASTDPTFFFYKICDDIISQQLAGRAAEVIFDRFVKLFPSEQVTAQELLTIPDQVIRDIGASWAKVKYLKDLAEKTSQGLIRYELLSSMSDEEVITELTKVKGIGRWTAEMFLIFTLGRPDVFSFGDLGLKKGFMKLYQVESSPEFLQLVKDTTERWAPYRSYGSLALWKHLDNR